MTEVSCYPGDQGSFDGQEGESSLLGQGQLSLARECLIISCALSTFNFLYLTKRKDGGTMRDETARAGPSGGL